ncbi:MAG: methyltransferase [Burkholderiaceae bacterium]
MVERGAPAWPSSLKASALWHGAMAAGLVAAPAYAAWWAGGLVANLLLTGASVTPRSGLLGPNLVRLPMSAAARGLVALTFDDGPDPWSHRRCSRHSRRPGRGRPSLHRRQTGAASGPGAPDRGRGPRDREPHAVAPPQLCVSRAAGLRAEIRPPSNVAQLAGCRPCFFRAPAGMRNPWLEPVLRQLDLRLVSWPPGLRRSARRRGTGAARLTRRLAAGDILVLHDGHAARTTTGEPVVLKVLPRCWRGCGPGPKQRAAAQALGQRLAPAGQKPHEHVWRHRDDFRELAGQAAARPGSAGRFAHGFARGKLTGDPVFEHLLRDGLVSSAGTVLDLGSGQGVLAALVRTAQRAAAGGRWPAAWAAAPSAQRLIGVELMPRDVARGRQALGEAAEFIEGDIVSTAFPAADAVVILDVLHYIDHEAQRAVLDRVATSLDGQGVLLLRIGDADGGWGFRISQAVDRVVTWVRGHRLQRLDCRPLPQWQALLEALGFEVEARPMSQGTLFSNVLLIARPGRRPAS